MNKPLLRTEGKHNEGNFNFLSDLYFYKYYCAQRYKQSGPARGLGYSSIQGVSREFLVICI